MKRRDRQKLVVVGSVAGVIILLLILLLLVIRNRQEQADLLAEQARLAAEAAIPPPPPVIDPFENRGSEAIERVQAAAVAPGESVTSRIDRGDLARHIELYALTGADDAEWTAERVEGSVYEVIRVSHFEELAFGPRWVVQMDPNGPAPAGSGGVVPANALARQLHKSDVTSDLRYMNRSREVVQALTEHRFDGGVRLGSAFLIYFAGLEARGVTPRLVGWSVVPEQIDPNGELSYRAVFQWVEGDTAEDAIWNVNYAGGQPSFRPGDQRADELMRNGATVSQDQVLDIRPVSLREVQRDPATERDARVRALRFLLADTRVVEAVGALLAFRDQTAELEYVQWHSQFTEADRTWCDVEYRFRLDGVEQSVSWRVRIEDGYRVPSSPLAELAEQVLAVFDRAPRQMPALATAGSGAGAGEGSGPVVDGP